MYCGIFKGTYVNLDSIQAMNLLFAQTLFHCIHIQPLYIHSNPHPFHFHFHPWATSQSILLLFLLDAHTTPAASTNPPANINITAGKWLSMRPGRLRRAIQLRTLHGGKS